MGVISNQVRKIKKVHLIDSDKNTPTHIDLCLSQNNDCADFLSEEESFKYIDDLSILEFINLISVWISWYKCKLLVPNDIGTDNKYIPPENLQTQSHLDRIQNWTEEKKMKVNTTKS